jgi:hypothetical protein
MDGWAPHLLQWLGATDEDAAARHQGDDVVGGGWSC